MSEGPRASLLFVDDEPRVLEALQRRMRAFRKEWDVSFASDGHGALARIEQQRCDFIVCDMRMPGMNGTEVLQRVCETRPSVVRVVLSGQTDYDAAMRSVTLAHQFLGKPCAPELLIETLARIRGALDCIDSPAVRDGIIGLRGLASASPTLHALRELLAKDEPSLDAIAELVARDAAMSARVLQLVGSGFFGLSGASKDVRAAVRCLGVRITRDLATRVFDAATDADVASPSDAPLVERVGLLLQSTLAGARDVPEARLGTALLRLWGAD